MDTGGNNQGGSDYHTGRKHTWIEESRCLQKEERVVLKQNRKYKRLIRQDTKPAICMTVRMSKDGFFIEENGGNLHKIAVFLNANDIFLCEFH